MAPIQMMNGAAIHYLQYRGTATATNAVRVGKHRRGDPPNWTRLDMELRVPFAISMRLDRLLASELKISRTWLQALHDGVPFTSVPIVPML